jgi:long-chain acyl-CoA synthetase
VTNVAQDLINTARRQPEDIALRLDESEMSYANLDAASACVAGLLVSRGLRPGDRVGVMLPNVPHFAMVYFGVLRAGGVVVPMNVLLERQEAAFHLSDAGASFIFAWPEFVSAAQGGADAAGAACLVVTPMDFEERLAAADPVAEPAPRADTDIAVILYTSGTTGSRKSVELTHANLRGDIAVVVDLLALTPSDVILGALPLFDGYGQTAGLNAAVVTGSCLTLIPRFTPEKAISIIGRDGVTVFEGVPEMFAAMLHATSGPVATSMRLCISSGDALPGEVVRTFEKTFGCAVLEHQTASPVDSP